MINKESFSPAPWQMSGKGYIFLYPITKEFVMTQGMVPDFLKGRYTGGFGSMMLVNYADSNVGPYSELLFIPGKFDYKGKKWQTISKIYVSSEASIVNGRKNWGIPKERATFEFKRLNEREERIIVTAGETRILDVVLRSGVIPFPVSTKFLPFHLVQREKQKEFYTSFSGKGTGRLAKVKKISVDSDFFPDVSLKKPLAVVHVDPFMLTFPVPRIEKVDVHDSNNRYHS